MNYWLTIAKAVAVLVLAIALTVVALVSAIGCVTLAFLAITFENWYLLGYCLMFMACPARVWRNVR